MTSLKQAQQNLLSRVSEMESADTCDCVHPDAVRKARENLDAQTGMDGAAEIFAVLGDPTRVRVLTALRAGELCVSDLAVTTGVNRTTVSHQLRVLRTHRLVNRRREGKVVFYAIADEHVEALLDMAFAHASEDADPAGEMRA